MINVKELRIGNVITDENGSKYVVIGLQDNRIVVQPYGLHPEYPIEGIEINACGIPLTEELLLKCGFEKVIKQQLFGFPQENFYQKFYEIETSKCPLVMIKENGHLCHVIPSDGEFGCSFIPVLYIHQFQNLYYSLSGKEIEVNFS